MGGLLMSVFCCSCTAPSSVFLCFLFAPPSSSESLRKRFRTILPVGGLAALACATLLLASSRFSSLSLLFLLLFFPLLPEASLLTFGCMPLWLHLAHPFPLVLVARWLW